jgi:hypothetical protein
MSWKITGDTASAPRNAPFLPSLAKDNHLPCRIPQAELAGVDFLRKDEFRGRPRWMGEWVNGRIGEWVNR